MKTYIKWLRLWLATKLLGFMAPNYCLVKALRNDGQIEWDGGKILGGEGGDRVVPVGLFEIVEESQ